MNSLGLQMVDFFVGFLGVNIYLSMMVLVVEGMK